MNSPVILKSALISVYNKDGLAPVIKALQERNVTLYSTGGTETFIQNLGVPVIPVESITGYPSILGGRVKTLHPGVFGGILAMRTADHLAELNQYDIPEIDLVIVDLYPFEDTVKSGGSHEEIIEKIDIGGISLIRAAAKNYKDVVIISSRNQYPVLLDILDNNGVTTETERKKLAVEAFALTSHYDTAIFNYMSSDTEELPVFKRSIFENTPLRYGENPHQKAFFFGHMDEVFEKYHGKELSYNNLMDIDAALQLLVEFQNHDPTFVIIKHTNACGVATRQTLPEAWDAALACDSVSAFGGILACNITLDMETAMKIDQLFYEVLLAPGYEEGVLDFLKSRPKRVILRYKDIMPQKMTHKSILNGIISQEYDSWKHNEGEWKNVTRSHPDDAQWQDLIFANTCVKHLKSNTIVLVKNRQLVGMGCGQTSRVDACRQAIEKAHNFGFDLKGAVMASDAFFPFPDCVEMGYEAGITSVVQPGGSIKDQLSIDYCNEHQMSMVFTGIRHFKH